MPAGASGVLITVNMTLLSLSSSSQHMLIYKDGFQIGATGISLTGGFASSAVYTMVDPSPTVGSATYEFYGYNPPTGPGGSVSASVSASSIVVTGAKR
jgi:hypothetical protein